MNKPVLGATCGTVAPSKLAQVDWWQLSAAWQAAPCLLEVAPSHRAIKLRDSATPRSLDPGRQRLPATWLGVPQLCRKMPRGNLRHIATRTVSEQTCTRGDVWHGRALQVGASWLVAASNSGASRLTSGRDRGLLHDQDGVAFPIAFCGQICYLNLQRRYRRQPKGDQNMSVERKGEPSFQTISIERIDSAPFQIRQSIDADSLRELASSMQQVGLLQPILVRPKEDRFEIVAGERRFRAAKLLGWASIPGRLEDLSDVDAAVRKVIENDQRVDAKPLERAQAFHHLRDAFNLGQDEIATRVGIHKSVVSRMLALLEQPKEIQQMLADESISPTHLRSLDEIPDEAKRVEVAAEVAKQHLSTRETGRRAHKVAKAVKAKARDGTSWLDVSDWLGRLYRALRDLTVMWRALKTWLDFLAGLIAGREQEPRGTLKQENDSQSAQLPAESEVKQPGPPKAA